MKLRLDGHDYKYAVEQILLALFPAEKPDYSIDPIVGSFDLFAESVLRLRSFYAQATTVIHCGDSVSRGTARIKRDKLTGKLVTDRLLQRIIKQSFYRAASNRLESPPAWGSLTGIRPARLAATAIEVGLSGKAAARALSRDYYVSAERASMCVDAALASLTLKETLKPDDIALYVGVPFCPTRCAYCSFVSNSVEKSHGLIEPFVRALLLEIDAASRIVRELGLRIVSVYVGGGTPTSLPADSLEIVLRALGSSFDLSHAHDYTVEAGRPDTMSAEKVGIIRRYGANRVCVNPQSMSQHVLSAIGRRHTPEDVREAVRLVRDNGGKSDFSLNIDIIAGLPGDTPEQFRSTLDTVLGFNPENITVHTLSLKKGSRIMLEGTAIPSGAEVAKMLGYAEQRLRDNGFSPYYLYRQKFTSGGFENTGWSLQGYEGVYNICMMEELCTVLALGGGGVTKLVSHDGRIERVFNAKYPREYILRAENLEEKFTKIEAFYTE